jgi:hypothetical protein
MGITTREPSLESLSGTESTRDRYRDVKSREYPDSQTDFTVLFITKQQVTRGRREIMVQPGDIEEAERRNTYRPIYNPLHPKPVHVRECVTPPVRVFV